MNPLAAFARGGVRAIDLALQRYYHVFEFTDDSACILRVARSLSARDIELSDGTRIARGEPVLELHLWNEQLPALPRDGAPSLTWGIEMTKRARHSLRLLAAYLARAPQFDHIRALHGEAGFLELDQFPEMRVLAERLGFDFVPGDAPGWRVWKYAFWQNLFSWWLMWTFNPASLRGKHFDEMARSELWMSRAVLMEKFGERAAHLAAAAHVENWRTS
jgi:hypothetical protein